MVVTLEVILCSISIIYLRKLPLYITQSTAILCDSLNYVNGMDIIITLALCIHIGIYYVTEYHAGCDVAMCMCENHQ